MTSFIDCVSVFEGGITMSTIRNQLIELIDCLPESEQSLLLEIARRFIPDDVATPDDIAAHNRAMEEYKRGEAIEEDAIKWMNI